VEETEKCNDLRKKKHNSLAEESEKQIIALEQEKKKKWIQN